MPTITFEHLDKVYDQKYETVNLDSKAMNEVIGTAVTTYDKMQRADGEMEKIRILTAAFVVWIENGYNLNPIIQKEIN